ncbi:PREDICTED: uncharacterized protein LOC104733864 [Camelina sativa]|uniref:Uncharacterized protein LOC104733864 n=1 Tax=Camelina sativa TaxID=90675 RepID=A0ABM0V6M8_CAMSA|nr:PREDICTED: uncharacterized protein LOC104733864 [Camelina sativa]
MIRHCGLLEFPAVGDSLSWRGWWDKKPIRCRLDRALANEKLHDMFSDSFTEYLPMIALDHKPVLASLEDKTRRGRSSFRFDRRWLDKEGLFGAIAEGWDSGAAGTSGNLPDKILKCRQAISQWQKTQVPYGRETIEDLKTSLATAQADDSVSVEVILELSWKLREAYRDEEIYWYQKSRSRWMRLGDQNTSYFHAQTKQRRAKNRIVGLHDEAGHWVMEERQVQGIDASYFQELFTSTEPSNFEETLDEVCTSITDEINEALTCPVT